MDTAVNVSEGLVLYGDEIVPITNWIDEDGECERDDAAACVAGPLSDGKWLSLDLREFEEVEVH